MMHDDELAIDEVLVRRLLSEQLGDWADLPLLALEPPGTVNAMFRLGEDKCVRLPRLTRYAEGLRQELTWLPRIAPLVTLAVPQPLVVGRPSTHFPLVWAVYRWLEGTDAGSGRLFNEKEAAEKLAAFILQLRQLDISGAPRSTRDRPLAERDGEVQGAIAALPEDMDRPAIRAAWRAARQAPKWSGRGVWTHGDLLPANLVLQNGDLTAVIDFGNMGVGDPAVDLIAAWTIFSEKGRRAFRAALNEPAGTWSRSRGLALHQALLIIPYYLETNPAFSAMARRTVQQILLDLPAD